MSDSISAETAIKVMICALGDPPHTPPGCAKVLAGCISVLDSLPDKEHLVRHDHPSLYSIWMRFITAPRSEAEIAQLTLDLEICRCHTEDVPKVLSNAPPALHTLGRRRGESSPNLTELLDTLIVRVTNALTFVTVSPRLFRAKPTPEHQVWPTYSMDLMPFSPFTTLHMLDAWCRHQSRVFIRMGVLYNELMNGFGQQLVPALTKTHSGTHYIHGIVGGIARMDYDNTVPRLPAMGVQHSLTFFVQVANIIKTAMRIMSSDELIVWLDDGEHTLEDHILLCVVLLDYARTIVKHLPTASRTPTMQSNVDTVEFALLGLAETIWYAQPNCIDTTMVTQEFRWSFDAMEKISKNPFSRLLKSGYHSEWKGRCHGPGCLQTEPATERRFKCCGQCKTAFYCSRRCQKRAWRFIGAPHRELCVVSYAVRVSENRAKTSNFSTQVFLERLITRSHAERAVVNVENLHKSQFEAMSTSQCAAR
jgi:hypothetical protein